MEFLISIAGSLLGTALTTILVGNPTFTLVGAALGACAGPAVAMLLPSERTSPGVALLVTLGALAVTYLALTGIDLVRQEPNTIFPTPTEIIGGGSEPATGPSPTPGIQPPQPSGPAIAVSPETVRCTGAACDSVVTVRSTGDKPLKIGDVEFTGQGAATFDHDGVCANTTLTTGESCVLRVDFTPPPRGGTVTARLVIHQNLPGPASYVALEGDAGPKPVLDLVLSPDNVDCVYQRSGALGPKDAVQFFLMVRLTGATVDELPGLVPVRAVSDSGAATEFSTAIGTVGSGVVAALPLRAVDYDRAHVVTITLDPTDSVGEADEGNNRIRVRVDLPVRPSESTVPLLPCSAQVV